MFRRFIMLGILIIFSHTFSGCRARVEESESSSIRTNGTNNSGLLWAKFFRKEDGYCWFEYLGQTDKNIDLKKIKAESKPLGERAFSKFVLDRLLIELHAENMNELKKLDNERDQLIEDSNKMKNSFIANALRKKVLENFRKSFDLNFADADNSESFFTIMKQGIIAKLDIDRGITTFKEFNQEEYGEYKSLLVRIHQNADLEVTCQHEMSQ